jgi:hypothetical protein
MGINVAKVYAGNLLTANDVGPQPRRVVIESVGTEILGEGSEARQRVVCSLHDSPQKLVLNRTNASVLVEAFGSDGDEWAGKAIILRVERVQFGGKLVPAIRVSVPPPAQPPRTVAQPQGKAPPPKAQADLEDDIPW